MSDDEGAGDGATGGAGVPDIKKPTASAYYDWSADKSKRAEELSRMGVDVTPKVVSPAAAPVAAPLAKAVSTGSAWNAAGTWYVPPCPPQPCTTHQWATPPPPTHTHPPTMQGRA